MEETKIGLSFGAMSKPISEQLTEQGFKFNEETLKHFQLDSNAINRLRIQSFINRSAADTAEKKLFKKIINHINNENKICLK